jgi:hypothetical protein
MDYKYPPIYKYIILLILITTFLRYYKVVTKENFLLIAGIFTYMVFIFDFILIKNHPSLLTETQNENFDNVNQDNKKVIYIKKNKPKKNKLKVIKENEELVDTDLDEKFEKELEELNKKTEDTESENLTDEIQRELDELDL